MILEAAPLDVRPGQEAAFEAAFAEARHLIASIAGYRALRLERCVEQRNRYLLLVEWDTLEAHTVGFRGSPQYQQWRALLHRFYEPMPTVLHYEAVFAGVAA
jgi:heme-degrading monooxygenase HmoA